MSYTAAPIAVGVHQSIDTLNGSWIPGQYDATQNLTWGTANLAIYVPLRVPSPVTVTKLWYADSTTFNGNVDMALYRTDGTLVVAASQIAKPGSGTEVIFDITDTFIPPGAYYVGLSMSNATDTFRGMSIPGPFACAYGVLVEANAYPLPSTATFAIEQGTLGVPLMGLLLGTIA